MFSIKDLNELLEKIPIWKRITQTPDKIEELGKRILALENKLSGKGDVCPKCKEPSFELISSNVRSRVYKCTNCGFEEKTLRHQ